MKQIGLTKAQTLVHENTNALESIQVPLQEALNHVVGSDMVAKVDSPSVDAALKDGFAVRATDWVKAGMDRPITLELVGRSSAGGQVPARLESGQTIRATTGAPLPPQADAVVPVEQVREANGVIRFDHSVKPGQDILPKGSDARRNQTVASAGEPVTPGLLGLLAAAGYSHLNVVRLPRIAIISTGDEVMAPGMPLTEGKLYASNLTTLDAWCRGLGYGTKCLIVGDNVADTIQSIENISDGADAVITSGGAWVSDRDRVALALENLRWQKIFHGVRMLPGKGAGFGLLDKKPVFMLPGGPSANFTAFLQLALPGLCQMAGCRESILPVLPVVLGSKIKSRHANWSQFVFGKLQQNEKTVRFEPLKLYSRLQSMAAADALAVIPEGQTQVPPGERIGVQVLNWRP